MKICHITNQLPNYHRFWGGAEQACYRILKVLAKNGVENTVLAIKPIKEVKDDFDFYSVPVLQDYIGEKLASLLKRPYDIVAYRNVYKLLKKIKPDVLHLHNFGNIGFGAVIAAKKLNIPVIFSAYDFWFLCPLQNLIKYDGTNCRDFHSGKCIDCIKGKKDALQKMFIRLRRPMFDKYLFNEVDKIIVLAEQWKRLLEEYGINEDKIAVIPLPLKREAKKKSKIEKNSVLYVGWLVPRKGLHILLEAIPYVLKEFPDAKLYVAGEYDQYEMHYKDTVEEIISRNKIEKSVVMLGKQPYSEVEKLILKANVVAVPEQWQIALSTFMNEALIYGKPVVASNIGGIPEYLHDKKTGLLAETKDAKDFAEKIIFMLKNGKKAKEMGKKAEKDMKAMLDEKIIFKKLFKLYSELIQKSV